MGNSKSEDRTRGHKANMQKWGSCCSERDISIIDLIERGSKKKSAGDQCLSWAESLPDSGAEFNLEKRHA